MMIRTLATIIACIVLLTIYKMQHVRPVDDPKDSPIFQQRLQSSLDRFQENEFPAGPENMQARQRSGTKPPSPRPPARTRDLVVTGRCGNVTLTWVEEKKIAKETISIKRRVQGEKDYLLPGQGIYEREEEGGGIRYWASDKELTDGVHYEYLISFKDLQDKEVIKKPVSISLTCTEQDREIVAQREKMIKEYYQKKGVDPKQYADRTPPVPTGPPARINDVVVSGRCGRVSLTWLEEQKIAREKITIKRKSGEGGYVPLKGKKIYEREEEGGGVRYWLSDSELTDGKPYEYLVSFLDAQGKESIKKPVSINLTCNERDREIVAQRDKMIKEYYQQKGIKPQNADSAKPPSYTLSEEVRQVDLGKAPRKGREDASVTLVVFTDFECVYCSTWSETLETMLQTFPDDIQIVYKNFPLTYHKQAELAAAAALAAGEQGKFWEMHNLLYKNRNALTREDILGYAKVLKLDGAQFEESLDSEEISQLIDQEKTQGQKLGVRNIPTTFINGRSLTGSPPPSYIKGVIEEILKKQ
jgi:protein-disulfide isomerase